MSQRPVGSPNNTIRKRAKDIGLDSSRDHEMDHLNLLRSGPVNVQLWEYSVPTYDAVDATTMAKCFQMWQIAEQQTFIAKLGTEVPWNPAWHLPSTAGNDRLIQIVDGTTVYDLWMVQPENSSAAFPPPPVSIFGRKLWTAPNRDAGFQDGNTNHLAIGSLTINKSIYTAQDWQSKGSRGCGQFKRTMVVDADDVKRGVIPHRLPFTISNPAYGVWNPATKKFDAPVPHRGPAFRLEHLDPKTLGYGGVTTTPPPLSGTLGSGHAMAHDMIRLELEAILVRHCDITSALGKTCMTFAVALGEEEGHGGQVAETGGFGCGIETNGMFSPKDAAIWNQCGIVKREDASVLNAFLNDVFSQAGRWHTLNERFVTKTV